MKTILTVILSVMTLCVATPALAGGGDWLIRLTNDTNRDFESVKHNFRAAYTAGYTSWEAYGKATGFSINDMESRIRTRRAILKAHADTANERMDSRTRGLMKMLIRDLDRINLSMLALIMDDRGYAGYIRTPDEELIGPVSEWQEGIRQSISELKRSLKMVSSIMARENEEPRVAEVTIQ